MAKLQVALLGQFSVATEDGPFNLQPSSARLLAYLALAGGRPVPTPRAAGVLWPDLSEQRARANLSTVTWRLRLGLTARDVSAEVVLSTGVSLGLDLEQCDVDVEYIRRNALSPGAGVPSLEAVSRAVHAVGLYRGDLLEDWDVEWCSLEREGLRRLHLNTLRALAEAFERRGRLDHALRYIRQAADADPFDEPAQRLLMRLLVLVGDRTSAINQFHKYARLVRSELGTEPDAETVALAQKIRERTGSHLASLGSPPVSDLLVRPERSPLVGRLEPRRWISALLDAAVAGNGGGLLLLGEAGAGKSRLAEWAMEEWAARGGSATRGRCVEFNEPVPYQPLLDALSAYVDAQDLAGFIGERAAELPDLRPGPGEPDPRDEKAARPAARPPGKLRLFNWLRARLEDAGRLRPLLVVVEDLQWADAGTRDFLAYLLEHARTMRLAVLLTARPVPDRGRCTSGAERLARYCVGTLRLDPLSAEETDEFVRALVGGGPVPSRLAHWLYTETEGNPLFVIEMLRLLQQQGRLTAFGQGDAPGFQQGADPGAASAIPDGVRSTVQQRLAFLDATSLRVAEIASVLGRTVEEDLLAAVARTGQNRLSRALADLVRARILEREGTGYRFSHDKIRAVCYENLPGRVRRDYHARAAAALAQMPEVPTQRLAWHQFGAGQWHLAAATWTTAGDRAREMYAYEEALRAYRHAIACARRDTTRNVEERYLEEVRLLVRVDEVLTITGQPAERRLALEQMAVACRRSGSGSAEAAWLLRRALLEEHAANFGVAHRLARRAWRLARTDGDLPAELEALRLVAWALNRLGRHRRSLAVSRLALRKAGSDPSPAKAALLQEAATVYVKLSDYAAAMSHLQAARRTQIDLGSADEDPHILLAEGLALKWSGDLASARIHFNGAMRSAGRTGDVVSDARITFQLATLDALEGRLGDSLRRLRHAITISRSAGYTRTYISCLNEVANGVGRVIGNYPWAWDASNRAIRLARSGSSNLLAAVCRDSQAHLLLDQGRLAEALSAAGEALRLQERERGSLGPNHEYLARRGAILIEMGNLDQAIEDLELARRGQVQTGDRLVLVDTLTYLALAYAGVGDPNRALATSDDALRLLAEIGYANYQPQRVFWHHHRILEIFDPTPRLEYLKRAVEFIGAQAATLSCAQARRLREGVRLNRDILEAWNRVHPRPTVRV